MPVCTFVLIALRETVVRCLLKKASVVPNEISSPKTNPFLSKLLKWVVAAQLQAVLEEIDDLDSFQSGLKPCFKMEAALDALTEDLCWESDKRSSFLLILLNLSLPFLWWLGE